MKKAFLGNSLNDYDECDKFGFKDRPIFIQNCVEYSLKPIQNYQSFSKITKVLTQDCKAWKMSVLFVDFVTLRPKKL